MQKWWIVQNSPQPGLRSRSKRTGDSCQSVLALIISSLTPLNLIFPSWVIYSSSSSTVMISLFLSLEPLELLPLFSLPLMSSCCFLSTASKSDPSNSFANLRDSEITATSFLSMGHSCFSATFSLTVSSCRFARGWTAAVSELFCTAFAESSIRFFEIARVGLNLGSALIKLVQGLLRSFGGCIFAKLPSLLVTLMSTALNGDFVKDFAGLAGGISNSVRLCLFFSLACAAFLSIASCLLSFFFCPACADLCSIASLLLAQKTFCGQRHDARLNPSFLSLGLSSAFGWSIASLHNTRIKYARQGKGSTSKKGQYKSARLEWTDLQCQMWAWLWGPRFYLYSVLSQFYSIDTIAGACTQCLSSSQYQSLKGRLTPESVTRS